MTDKLSLTIEPTEHFFLYGGAEVRAWKGSTQDGAEAVALVALVRLADQEQGPAPDLVPMPPPDGAAQLRWAEQVIALQEGPKDPRTRALLDIEAERDRQRAAEGYTLAHDDNHRGGELAWAAAAYALNHGHGQVLQGLGGRRTQPNAAALRLWPWDKGTFKPKSPRADLVRAAALLAAEIERLDRIAVAAMPVEPEPGA